jgi:hypothetical protein
MATPKPVGEGTGVFIAFTVLCIVWFWAASRGGYISKDSFQ